MQKLQRNAWKNKIKKRVKNKIKNQFCSGRVNTAIYGNRLCPRLAGPFSKLLRVDCPNQILFQECVLSRDQKDNRLSIAQTIA